MSQLEPQSVFIETNAIRLHALIWPGDGPTLLCTHGLAYNAWLFGRFGRRFSPRYRVVSLDLRGHGDSDKPADGYHYADQAADLAGVVAFLGEAPILVAHSHGGRIGLYAAAHQPDLFSRIILADTSLFRPQAESERTLKVRRNMTEARYRDWDEYDALMRRSKFNRNWTPDLERFLRFNAEVKPDGRIGPKLPPAAAAGSYRCLEDHDLVADLDRVRCPVAIVRGGEGNCSDEMAVTLRERLPLFDEVLVADANHNIVLDRPDEFESAVEAFLAGSRRRDETTAGPNGAW